MMLQKAQITEQHLKKAQAQVDRIATELERSRDLGRVIVHVDMDAFYAAVEMRDCPELKDKPMAVGSMSMLDSPNSSPSCLPGCEDGNAAGGAFEVFGKSVEEAVREMRFRIEQRTMLTASAGIAPNTMLAKVCSDKNKPNGQYRLPSTREAVMDFIQTLPVRKVSGIGKVSEKMLNALGISSCSHLGQQMALLSLLFSETAWHHLMEVSLGLGSTYIPRYLTGKTVTLKLKNVNFEVKTRALTLPYAVATVDEIFAVAKDLLKTERDNESPQPLRLRLMGVRISAFVSSDDKKPLQKSIIGFLQAGKSDSSDSSQGMHQKLEKENVSSHSFQTPQNRQEGAPGLTTQKGFKGSQTDRGRPLPMQAAKGKTKRRDSPSSPPSKKAKGLGPRNTIDKFFR
ncbi:DNA polymerase kappa [Nibea albiflora]|nr:DNA polymerase kappa [Nibea albiflora]